MAVEAGIAQRRTKRVYTELPVRLLGRDAPVEMVAGNINADGLFLRTVETPDHGALLQIEVLLPDGPLPMFVRVRFVGRSLSGRGLGVALFSVEDRSRWIRTYETILAQS